MNEIDNVHNHLPTVGGIAAVLLGVVYLLRAVILKWMDRWRSPAQQRRESDNSMRTVIEFQSKQIEELQKDVKSLRDETRAQAIKLYKLTLAVHHCCIEFPDTTSWWSRELENIGHELP